MGLKGKWSESPGDTSISIVLIKNTMYEVRSVLDWVYTCFTQDMLHPSSYKFQFKKFSELWAYTEWYGLLGVILKLHWLTWTTQAGEKSTAVSWQLHHRPTCRRVTVITKSFASLHRQGLVQQVSNAKMHYQHYNLLNPKSLRTEIFFEIFWKCIEKLMVPSESAPQELSNEWSCRFWQCYIFMCHPWWN
jgi:hypothetical protein